MQVTGSERRLERAIARRWLALVALVAACVLAAPAAAAAQSVTVTVDIAGTGSGTVTSSPSGINCSGSNTSCAAGFTGGAAVTLTATATSGHTFLGWTGICSGTGTCQFNAVDGALAVAQFDSPTAAAVTYYHLDAIGSVRALTDGSGNVLIRHDYFPFGEDAQAMTGDPLRFTGQEIDAESDQHYFQARQYRQIWGRFTTVDPGHVNGSLEDPQGWNGYAYARNNPLVYVDPDGRTYVFCLHESCNDSLSDSEFEALWAEPGEFVRFHGTKWAGDIYWNETRAGSYWHYYPNLGVQAVGVVLGASEYVGYLSGATALGKALVKGLLRAGLRRAAFSAPVRNVIPDRLARVVPLDGTRPITGLGLPGATDVFVTAADDIAGLGSREIAERRGIGENARFMVIEFLTPRTGIASPILRSNPGFVGRGLTSGGAREFVVPNGPIPANASIRIVGR